MMKANGNTPAKVKSLAYIKPDRKGDIPVVKSLEEWAYKILHRENNEYVREMSMLDRETQKRFEKANIRSTQYHMTSENYKSKEPEASDIGEIRNFTAAAHRRKTKNELFLYVSKYMNEEINEMVKKTERQKPQKNSLNHSTMPKIRQHVLLHFTTRTSDDKFATFNDMFNHLRKDKSGKKKTTGESSEEDPDYQTSEEEE
jgi:hypothetical protein